ncbi:MAG: hypothetical protein DRJ33_08035 [Candidatus Methanomethylicota archaeon]|uniref:Uncharacterized protein n=1 Tax=Thermoproteota archaeon TaxID=2056631 RepID=A0A497EQL9_9CREN|nr:MAG: hypothetical protein DRJ33_08035 [Candidatus Verstraetearchaeota archaeon]
MTTTVGINAYCEIASFGANYPVRDISRNVNAVEDCHELSPKNIVVKVSCLADILLFRLSTKSISL